MKNRGISFWHLVRNLTNNYLLKKLLKWPNKKCKNFNIYNVVFILKNEENHLEISLFYTCVPQILMIWSTFPEIWSMTDWNWQFWVVFCPFTTPEISEFWKNKKKNCQRCCFAHVYQNHNYVFWDTEMERIFYHFGAFFTL